MELKILVLPTYNLETLAVMDISVYDTVPPVVVSPTLEIKVPGFTTVYLPFTIQTVNVFNSTDLGITTAGNELPIPDGIYCFKYTVDPPLVNFVEKSIMRVEKLQERFDKAFMTLEMMECDRAIKAQAKLKLNTIYLFIQAAIAAANNCATIEAAKLYIQAEKKIDEFLATNCGCIDSYSSNIS